ncbi:hypothetical protein AQUCO_05500086v1 [Aquilegia coerulea]|uniref:C3H1-type domain-containing protein n=1 Tax=Aquilegia coerulea TaxID=218851 RepID=A0A2G5CGW0_AQUCA|nr:hypothetical protein AQUCO_05500086v1 [Aquilegia coerulea]
MVIDVLDFTRSPKPSISPTLLLSNMCQKPDMITPGVDLQGHAMDPRKIQEHFEDFYEDLFEELSKYGERLKVLTSATTWLITCWESTTTCSNALRNLTGRFYAGRPIIVDFSPVTDFREATCRQYEENTCNRGGYCNFMHLKMISRDLRRHLFGRYRRRHSRSRSRSRSPYRHHSYVERSHGSLRDRKYDERDHHYHDDRARRRRGRSTSPGGRRNRSPEREGSAERRAKIEQWNREREQAGSDNRDSHATDNNNDNEFAQYGGEYYDPQQQQEGGYHY